jgi:hypothetical protein
MADEIYLKGLRAKTVDDTIKALGAKRGNDVIYLDFSADTVASNQINGTLNGSALTAVNFTGSHAQTMQIFRTNLLLLVPYVRAVNVTRNNRRIEIIGEEGVDLVISVAFAVTGGASQPTITVNTTDAKTGLVDVSAVIVKDIMAIGGTKKYILDSGAGSTNFSKAYMITVNTNTIFASVTVSADFTEDLSGSLTGVTFPAGSVLYWDVTELEITSGIVTVHTLG